MGLFSARSQQPARTAIRSASTEVAAAVRTVGRAAVAATNDARIVAAVLLLAVVALALEMGASFHLL